MKSKMKKFLLGVLVVVSVMCANLSAFATPSEETGNVPAARGSTAGRGCQFLRDLARDTSSVTPEEAPATHRERSINGRAASL